MVEEYDWDTYDILKEQLIKQLPKIELNILNLTKSNYSNLAIEELFLIFTNYKNTSKYLRLSPLYQLSSKVIMVIASLRNNNRVIQDSVIEWLLEAKDQLSIWIEEMDDVKLDLSAIPVNIEKKVEVSKSYVPLTDIIQTLTILYLDISFKRAEKIALYLEKIVKKVIFSVDNTRYIDLIESLKYDILILNLGNDNYKYINLARKRDINIASIVIFDSIDINEQRKLIVNSIANSITNPLNGTKLKEALTFLVKHYFISRNIIIDNKKISNFIQTLKPLSNTLIQIMQICDDDEISIKELVEVVKGDPIITAVILKTANSPLYGHIVLKTIEQAVTRLGKTTIKALVVSDLYKSLDLLDLTPYGISEEDFSKISMNRLTLITKWYSKVSISDLSILSSTAVLGNIGQLLISKELMDSNLTNEFQELVSSIGLKHAEGKLLHTSTTTISAQILNYWKLSSDIINIISYSQNPNEISEELKYLVVANNIVYELIRLDGVILNEIPDSILVLMDKYNLDVVHLKNALEYVKNNK